MICLIPVGSPIVFVNHTACCSLALTWHAALLVLMGPTGTLCRTLAISTVRSTSHPRILARRMTSCRELGWCLKLLWGSLPRHAQHLYSRPQALTAGHRSGQCQDRVLSSCPAADVRSATALSAAWAPLSSRIASWQGQWERLQMAGLAGCERFWLGSVASKGTVVPGEAGTNAMLHSSEFTGNALHSSWGQRWAEDKSYGAKFSFPTLFVCCVIPHLIDFVGLKFHLMPSNVGYFKRGEPDTFFCGVAPLWKGPWWSQADWVLSIV